MIQCWLAAAAAPSFGDARPNGRSAGPTPTAARRPVFGPTVLSRPSGADRVGRNRDAAFAALGDRVMPRDPAAERAFA